MNTRWLFLCLGYQTVNAGIVLINAPEVLAISIHENDECWVNLKEQSVIQYGPSPEISNHQDYLFLRKTVYEKLKEAQRHLPKGIKFSIYEAYRSLNLQKNIFNKQFYTIKKQHPQWSEKDVFIETTHLVSPIRNFDKTLNIPPHATGGAIDVYLVDNHGHPLDMGIHPKDWMKDKDGILSKTNSQSISKIAQKNREMMSRVLSDVGLVNYATEYWHWSYGDKYWAYLSGHSSAFYGYKSSFKFCLTKG